MIDEQKIIGMLQAKALGCLDPEDSNAMHEFIDAGHLFPWEEFGKYQNVASLLPIALQLELPDAELKDRIALKLIKLSEQLRIKKILEEDKFEVEEELDENVDEFTNIPETYVEPPIEIENEETAVEENLASPLNPEETTFNLDEIHLTDIEGGGVLNENLQEDVKIESPFETLVDEAEIDYPQVQEVPLEEVLTEHQTPQTDTESQSSLSETQNTAQLISQQSTEIKPIEDYEDTDKKPDLTKKSVVEKVFKTLEQDFDSLKNVFDKSERKTTRGLLIAYVVIAILAALLIFSFFKFSSDINGLENEIKDLKDKMSSYFPIENKSNPDQYPFS